MFVISAFFITLESVHAVVYRFSFLNAFISIPVVNSILQVYKFKVGKTCERT